MNDVPVTEDDTERILGEFDKKWTKILNSNHWRIDETEMDMMREGYWKTVGQILASHAEAGYGELVRRMSEQSPP